MHRHKKLGIALMFLAMLPAARAIGDAPVLKPTSTTDEVLDALKAAGDNLKSFTADLRSDDFNSDHGTDTVRTGTLAVNTKPDGSRQLHLVYVDRQFGKKKPVPERKEYFLQDGWVTIRDFVTNKEERKQLAKPGQALDVFRLENRIIPMPIGQNKKEVLSRFDPTIAPADPDDPPGSIHLVLTPKASSEYADKYQKVEVWVDLKLNMPARVATTDAKGSVTTTHDLTNLKINPALPKEEFVLPPLPPTWQSDEEPLKN